MSESLPFRLRNMFACACKEPAEAADRIEQLEAALREFSCECNSNCEWERDEICHSWIARAALDAK